MLKKLYTLISIMIFVIPCILAVFFPHTVSSLATDALKLCINSIVPSLFPFMVITQILSRTGIVHTVGTCISNIVSPLLGVNRNLCGAVLIGAVGGFPNGAHAVGHAYKDGCCTKSQAEHAVALCNNCSLIYMCTVAGSAVLGSIKAGIILLTAEVISVIIISVALRAINKDTQCLPEIKYQHTRESFSTMFCKSITESGLNTLNMCSYIVFFYIISGLISYFVTKSPILQAVVKGVFEMSGGVQLCKYIDFPLNYIICSAIIGFSGISVIFQVCDVCEKYKLSAKDFILSRFINSILMPIISAFLLAVLPRETIYVCSVITNKLSNSKAASLRPIILYSSIILFVAAYIILKTGKKSIFGRKQ